MHWSSYCICEYVAAIFFCNIMSIGFALVLFSKLVHAEYVSNKYMKREAATTSWRYRMIQDGGQQRLCLLIA